MKKGSWSKVIVLTIMMSLFLMVPVYAAQTEVISIVSEDSGYKIVVPNFIDVREVEVDGEIIQVVVAEKPEKNGAGKYTFFEIQTTDEDASIIASSPGTFYEQIGDLFYELENGIVAYSPQLYVDFEELAYDNVFVFDFYVIGTSGEAIQNFNKIYFMFEEASKTDETDTTAVKEAIATPTASKVLVDGSDISFEAYNINGYNYFKLRDLAMAVSGTVKQFNVTWDAEKNAINLLAHEAYTSVGGELAVSDNKQPVNAIMSQSKIYLDGEEVALQAYTIGGNNYFKLRDIGELFNFSITWDGNLNCIVIDSNIGYTAQ